MIKLTKNIILSSIQNEYITNYEWEEFYVEYLKSLSENKLKEIENLINGKL